MKEQDLVDHGYRKWDGGAAKLKLADYYYAMMFEDAIGKMYQIVVYVYNYADKLEFHHLPVKISFMPEVQFRDRATDFCVDITYHVRSETTLEEIEEYYHRMWKAHDMPYYETYE